MFSTIFQLGAFVVDKCRRSSNLMRYTDNPGAISRGEPLFPYGLGKNRLPPRAHWIICGIRRADAELPWPSTEPSNICTIYDIGEENDWAFIAVE